MSAGKRGIRPSRGCDLRRKAFYRVFVGIGERRADGSDAEFAGGGCSAKYAYDCGYRETARGAKGIDGAMGFAESAGCGGVTDWETGTPFQMPPFRRRCVT
jgi:hypothetical protein